MTPARRRPYPSHTEQLAALPPWGPDPLARLEHTLAAHQKPARTAMALYAVIATHPEPGHPPQTGVTWGDLERLATEVRQARSARRALGGEH